MNILLWVLQIALAWLCIAGGVYQIFKVDELAKGASAMTLVAAFVSYARFALDPL